MAFERSREELKRYLPKDSFEELRKQVRKQYCCEDIISRNARIQQLFDIGGNKLPHVAQHTVLQLLTVILSMFQQDF